MKRLLLSIGALVALFSFSACEMNTVPIQNYQYTHAMIYKGSNQVGTNQGLVYPSDISNCIDESKAPQDPPLPKNVPHATWYNTDSPPTRFQKDVKVTMYFDNPNKLNRDGGYMGRPFCNSTVFAYSDPNTKTMHLPNPCYYPKTDGYARLACHELGHINGWPAYHGD